MSKVFKIYQGGNDTISHWGESVRIGSNAINSIPDPNAAKAGNEITSIPSPFARIDLAKRAFGIVANDLLTGLSGDSAYHKIVSDCLDVGQIFFNIEKYRDIIDIIEWDRNSCWSELAHSQFPEHRRLAKTYATFLIQDQLDYNFATLGCIYLLNYKDTSAPNVINIIGATSPASLFFSSANNLSFVGQKIKFGTDAPFDGNYCPLYQRDIEYIKFLWSMQHGVAGFSALFPEVDAYINSCYQFFTPQQKEAIGSITFDSYMQNYLDIPVSPGLQQCVFIAGEKLRTRPPVDTISSGFEMLVTVQD